MSDSTENPMLALWNSVEITDPAFTKPGQQGMTSINAIYMIKQATAQWGEIGFNWGFEIMEERIDNGAPVYDPAGEILGHTQTHTIRLALWRRVHVSGEIHTATIEQFGHTPYVYYSRNQGYWITDGEAPKKSLTDAMKKCLSLYGFSADIYLGMFDDAGYVEEVRAGKAIEKADDQAAEIVRQRQEYEALLEKNLKLIASSVSINELEALYTSISRKAQRRDDKSGLRQILDATNKRKEELSAKDKAPPKKAAKKRAKKAEQHPLENHIENHTTRKR